MAIGIVSFAFLTIVGLIPTGLKTFHSAIDTSVGGQIFQRVMNEVQQTDFDVLVDRERLPNYPADPPAGYSFRSPSVAASDVRYFDDQGNECDQSDAIYSVNIRIMPATAMVTTGAVPATNVNLATITVQIAKNPGNLSPTLEENLWKEQPGIDILTHSTLVARSQ